MADNDDNNDDDTHGVNAIDDVNADLYWHSIVNKTVKP